MDVDMYNNCSKDATLLILAAPLSGLVALEVVVAAAFSEAVLAVAEAWIPPRPSSRKVTVVKR